MTNELKATTAGLPAVEARGISYPLFYSILGMKKWAEHRGKTFQEAMNEGIEFGSLDVVDLGVLLRIGLDDGERRRHMVEGGSGRVLDGVVDEIFADYHVLELWTAIIDAWNNVGSSPKDPKASEAPSPGSPSSP